jgi:hypothetical protein
MFEEKESSTKKQAILIERNLLAIFCQAIYVMVCVPKLLYLYYFYTFGWCL